MILLFWCLLMISNNFLCSAYCFAAASKFDIWMELFYIGLLEWNLPWNETKEVTVRLHLLFSVIQISVCVFHGHFVFVISEAIFSIWCFQAKLNSNMCLLILFCRVSYYNLNFEKMKFVICLVLAFLNNGFYGIKKLMVSPEAVFVFWFMFLVIWTSGL